MLTSTATLLHQAFGRYAHVTRVVYRYAAGQGLLQLLAALNGFMLLRWLSIDEQAKFSMAMSIQATLGLLSDMGFGGSLLGLIGTRLAQKDVVGRYVAGIRFYKNRFFIASILIGFAITFFYASRQQWHADFYLIFGLLIASVYAQSEISCYAPLLQTHHALPDYYVPQLIAAAARLTLCFGLFLNSQLNALGVVALATAGLWGSALWMKHRAQQYFTLPPTLDPAIRHDIWRTLLPLVPMVVFYALQGQITVYVAGLFGKTQNIADMGALARISQIFALLSPFSGVVLLPYLARTPAEQLPVRLMLVLMAGFVVTLPIIALAYGQPQFFVWFLGDKFLHLTDVLGLYVTASSVWYLTSILWAINTARRWHHWSTSAAYILLVLAIQTAYIVTSDLASTRSLVSLSLWLALTTFVSYCLPTLRGLFLLRYKP